MAGLAGCAARQPVAPAPAAPEQHLAWTAAIGKLEVAGARSCTAVLVAPDLVATAAHCLNQNNRPATAAEITFLPNFGAEPELGAFPASDIRAVGGAISSIKKASDVVRDWALIAIAPPPRSVTPIAARALLSDQVLVRIAAGDTLYTAGYGNGSEKVLRQHNSCRIVADPALNSLYAVDMVVTDCIIRIGDSGGPIILLDASGRPTLIGIFSGFGLGQAVGTSYGVNVHAFADRLPAHLLSQALPQALSPVFAQASVLD